MNHDTVGNTAHADVQKSEMNLLIIKRLSVYSPAHSNIIEHLMKNIVEMETVVSSVTDRTPGPYALSKMPPQAVQTESMATSTPFKGKIYHLPTYTTCYIEVIHVSN